MTQPGVPASERELLAELQRLFGPPPAEVILGIGDDCAVLPGRPGEYLLWTVDSQVEGIHFDRRYTSWRQLGRKALAVNLSDIAAMGGEPWVALVSLLWDPRRDLGSALEVAAGIQETAARYQVAVVGGDTARSPGPITVTITLLGRVPREELCRRDGARPGDSIYVTGPLGLAAAALAALQTDLALPEEVAGPLQAALLEPQPQLAAGRLLARQHFATALIDLSDGVAADLGHLCRLSGVGAVVFADRVPVPPAVTLVARRLARRPLDLALRGGEDYQLLFTAAPQQEAALMAAFAAAGLPLPTVIGAIVPGSGVRLRFPDHEEELTGGFDHFSQSGF